MIVQDAPWAARLKPAAIVASRLQAAGRALVDALLPPMTWDRRDEAPAAPGLSPDAWARVTFLEAPVCEGCGAGFEFDGGAFAEARCAACMAQPYRFERARAACVYDEASRDLILRFKHGDHQEFAATDGEIQALEEAAITADERQVLARQFSHSRCLRRVDSQARPWKRVEFGCNYSHLGTLVNA